MRNLVGINDLGSWDIYKDKQLRKCSSLEFSVDSKSHEQVSSRDNLSEQFKDDLIKNF